MSIPIMSMREIYRIFYDDIQSAQKQVCDIKNTMKKKKTVEMPMKQSPAFIHMQTMKLSVTIYQSTREFSVGYDT